MGWSENLFNLVRIGELSCPEALANRNKSWIFSSWSFSLQLQCCMRRRSAQQYKWNELVRGKNILKCVWNGSSQTWELFLSTRPGTIENCNIHSSEGVLESMDHQAFLAIEVKTWSFLFSQKLLAATKLAFKYFWRRWIVCSLCAVSSEVIYQLSLVSLSWRSKLGLDGSCPR